MGLCVFHGLPAFQNNLPAHLPWENEDKATTCSPSWAREEASHGRIKATCAGEVLPTPSARLTCHPGFLDWGVSRTSDIHAKTRKSQATQIELVSCLHHSITSMRKSDWFLFFFFLTFSNPTAESPNYIFGANRARAGHLYPGSNRHVLGGSEHQA